MAFCFRHVKKLCFDSLDQFVDVVDRYAQSPIQKSNIYKLDLVNSMYFFSKITFTTKLRRSYSSYLYITYRIFLRIKPTLVSIININLYVNKSLFVNIKLYAHVLSETIIHIIWDQYTVYVDPRYYLFLRCRPTLCMIFLGSTENFSVKVFFFIGRDTNFLFFIAQSQKD